MWIEIEKWGLEGGWGKKNERENEREWLRRKNVNTVNKRDGIIRTTLLIDLTLRVKSGAAIALRQARGFQHIPG